VTSKVTVFVSPGASVMRWKPFSSFTGRVTLLMTSRMYSCTTSSPATGPVFVTSADTRADSPAAISRLSSLRFANPNVV